MTRCRRYVNCFESCQEIRPNDIKVPFFLWHTTSESWSRIHVDFAAPFEGRMWLIVLDAYSRWLEAALTSNHFLITSPSVEIKFTDSDLIQQSNGEFLKNGDKCWERISAHIDDAIQMKRQSKADKSWGHTRH